MKCTELQKDDIVVFEIDDRITGKKEVFDGNVSFVNEQKQLVSVSYLEGYRNHNVFVPFAQMIAKHDPGAIMFEFGRVLSGLSVLLEEYTGKNEITFYLYMDKYKLLDKWSDADGIFYMLAARSDDESDVIAIRNGNDIIEFDYIPTRDIVYRDYKDRELMTLEEKAEEEKKKRKKAEEEARNSIREKAISAIQAFLCNTQCYVDREIAGIIFDSGGYIRESFYSVLVDYQDLTKIKLLINSTRSVELSL